jgi:hypothetical protein
MSSSTKEKADNRLAASPASGVCMAQKSKSVSSVLTILGAYLTMPVMRHAEINFDCRTVQTFAEMLRISFCRMQKALILKW